MQKMEIKEMEETAPWSLDIFHFQCPSLLLLVVSSGFKGFTFTDLKVSWIGSYVTK